MPLARSAGAAAASLALLGLLAGPGPAATAEPDPSCTAGGPALRYVVLFDPGLPRATAESEAAGQCGSTAAYYPEIGVAVVDSAEPDFTGRMGRDRAYSAERQVLADRVEAERGEQAAGAGTAPDQQWNLRAIHAADAHPTTRGAGALVGVLDSGVDAAHPELAAALDVRRSANCLTPEDPELDAPPEGDAHGTHVAGIIAAADDGAGVTGVAPEARLASIRVVNADGYVHPEAAVCGFVWAAEHGVDVVNSSFLVESAQLGCTRAGSPVPREAVRRAVRYATERDVLTVAAVGNERADLTAVPPEREPVCDAVPTELDGVVSVAAVGPDEVKSGYSSYGLGAVDVAAPGGEQRDEQCVRSTAPGGDYRSTCGTSMAAPHVAGVAAMLASRDPDAGAAELGRRLLETARPLPCPADYDLDADGAQDALCRGYATYNGFYGHGLVDARAALAPPG
ncbi:S8 family serine peptidase [Saccharopolyspora sp. 6V]|uniref:S8 family peptidase n=1 Tax=Saccharopolyspora sp. 6V TaxID=2877239 RepID=UPI001CD53CAD|nr:S8 family serine peptidase [Saccharopolyspora sp. 6V]MCA1194691.1 S8 family serine peptidase [Saccharopolyspora sp. 6V]